MPKIQALYSRISIQSKDAPSVSITRQKAQLERKAEELGFVNTEHYSDENCSGGTMERPEFQRMLEDIDAGLIDAVLTYDLDRISRDTADTLNFVKNLEGKGVRLISLSDNYDNSPTGKLMLTVKSGSSQWYRDVIIDKVKKAMYHKAKNGDFCGGPPPFGYDVVDKHLVKNKEDAQLIQDIYNRFEDNPSFRGITIWLNAMGYKTKTWISQTKQKHGGTTFAQSSIRRILTNPLYKGVHTYGKRAGNSKTWLSKDKWLYSKGHLEPIISAEQFDRVQAIIARRAYTPQKRHGIISILAGVIRCECGGTMNGYTQVKKETGKKYSYYKCHNCTSKGTCPGNTWRKDELETKVMGEIRRRIKLYFTEEEARAVLAKKKGKDPQEHIKRINSVIAGIRTRQKNLMEAVEMKSMPKDMIEDRLSELKEELKTAESQLQKFIAEASPKEKVKRVSTLERLNKLNGDIMTLPNEVKADIVRQTVKAIVVKRTGQMEIDMYDV